MNNYIYFVTNKLINIDFDIILMESNNIIFVIYLNIYISLLKYIY